jgi:glutamate-1-semialdehyde 2,1-aminomutase
VPQVTRELTHTFSYNNLESLDEALCQHPSDIAAVILEPMNVVWPEDGFLEQVKSLAHEHGALLIFDETITGFRFAKGGAQELFGVTPDLATFGKGIANGFPLSMVVGQRDIMKVMDEIFFSFTFGGETLSLAAANAVLKKINEEPVLEYISNQGEKVVAGVNALIKKYNVGNLFSISGHNAWTFLLISGTDDFSEWEVKTFFVQEVLKRGVLTIGTHNISYSHSDEDVARLLDVYDEVFFLTQKATSEGNLLDLLCCEPIKPLFKLR